RRPRFPGEEHEKEQTQPIPPRAASSVFSQPKISRDPRNPSNRRRNPTTPPPPRRPADSGALGDGFGEGGLSCFGLVLRWVLMGLEGEGGGTGMKKVRKRQLVMESSDSEADDYCISTRQEAGASSVGNAGSGSRGDGDQSEQTAATISSGKVSGVKSSVGDGSVKNKGGEPESSSQPDPKRIRVEAVREGDGGSSKTVSKSVTGGKMLPRGFPAWRLEKPEVRAGWVLDGDGRVGMKTSSGSKMKEKVLSLDEKRGKAELQSHEERTPLKTEQGKSVNSGNQDVIRVQGKKGLLKILPKKNKMISDNVDSKILSKNTEVDEKAVKITMPTKRGVLKILPKKNNVVSETSDGNVPAKNSKVDGETRDGRILAKKTKVDEETSEGKILTNKTKLEGEFGSDNVPRKNSPMDSKAVAGKFLPRNSKVDGETIDRYKGGEEKSAALAELRKQDASGKKGVMGKLVSPIMLRKSDPSVVGLKISQNHHKPSVSRKDEITKANKHKKLKKRFLEHKGSPDNLSKKAKSEVNDLQGTSGTLNKHVMKKPRGGPRNKLKQDIRNQIKNILLDNGWKIELRSRRNKDYEDSVYVSPQGTGYWSITKAYAVFQEQFQNQRGCSSKLDNNELDDSNAISKDDLAMLKKNIVKRRTKHEIDDGEKKSGDSRSRNPKAILASSRNKHQNKEDRVKVSHRGCGLRVRGSTHNMEDNMDGYFPYKWKRTIYSWMIDLGVVSEDSKVKYMNNKGTRAMLEGKITREGIYCGCCSKILTVTKFELHAGSKEQQPYAHIFLEDGRISLLQCLLDAWEKHAQYENKGFYKIDPGDDPDDDTCAICGDGGDLVCCDHCTSTFHLDCLGIKMPTGEWYCRSCICRFCDSAQEDTSSPELLSCVQCSRKYHQACASRMGRDTKPGTPIDGFCSLGCRKSGISISVVYCCLRYWDTNPAPYVEMTQIYKRLNKLLGVKNNMDSGFSWSLVRCFADVQATVPKKKAQSAHCNSKTALAFSIMEECFQPHIDERSGINMIHNVVYNCGSDFSRLDFSGFYTFILERGDEVISAASVRIHGTDIAEMPFIGTRGMYRHQGMCCRLLNAIESALGLLNVRKLVIPAVPELENTWTSVFGFKPVDPSKKRRIKSINLLIINGTGLLEKRLLPTGTVDGQTTAMPANAIGCDKTEAQMFHEAHGSLTPVHVSRDPDVMKYHENPRPSTGSSAGLISEDLPPPAEETEGTLEKTPPVSVGDIKLNTLPGVDCEDNMQSNSDADDIQEGKLTESNGKLVAENSVAEQNHEDKPISSCIDSLAIHVTVDSCSRSHNDTGKGENGPSGDLSAEAALITDKTDSNLNINCQSARSSNKGDTCVVPFGVPSITMDGRPDNYDLKTMVAGGHTQSSTEAKGLNDIANTVNGTSVDAYRDKSTGEVNSAPSDDHGVSMNGYDQDSGAMEDKIGPFSPELECSSMSKDMMENLNESKLIETDKVEMNDLTIKVGTDKGSIDAGITIPTLDISNEVCGEVMAKPTQTCGEGQLHGDDGIRSNGVENDLTYKEPVNA
ncbi:hypothetical protein EJB05_15208, partial [Eragrostis curvula]